MTQISSISTPQSLLRALAEAAKQDHVSKQELLEQRISFVYGSLSPDSAITRAQVKKIIEDEFTDAQ